MTYRGPARAVLIAGLLLAIACGENEPPVLLADSGTDWAPWPPQTGTAGLSLIWTIDGLAPTAAGCEEVDLDLVRLWLVHPVADFETWTSADLAGACAEGEVRLEAEAGLAPGHYRFAVELLHPDGDPFQQEPWGETVLIAGAVVTVAAVNVTMAIPNDGG